jgi:hypothetical protein
VTAKHLADCRRATRAALRETGRCVSLALACAFVALGLPARAQPSQAQVSALEAKIAETPAQSIDLAAAARAAASGALPLPPAVPGSVVPGASKFKLGEARFIALFPNDERALVDFVRAERQLGGANVRLFRGAVRALAADEQPVTLKAVAFTGDALRFNAAHDQFEGQLSVGLVGIGDGRPTKLATAVPFQVRGAVVAVHAVRDAPGTPATLLVDHVGPPYAQIAIATPALACPLEVQVISAVVPEGVSLSVAGEPAVRLIARPTAIQGLGLQSADLTFELVGPRGAAAQSVQLGASLGKLEATSFRMGAGHVRTRLRSQRLGTATVTASAPGAQPVRLQIEFLFPWALLLGALAGSLIGGLLFYRMRFTRYQALASALLGLLMAALYAWSMEQAPIELPAPVGEILVFVLSIVGAYYAAKLYLRLVRPRHG